MRSSRRRARPSICASPPAIDCWSPPETWRSSRTARFAVLAGLHQGRELVLFCERGGGDAFLALLEDRDVGVDGLAVGGERRALLPDLFELAFGLRFAAAERFDAVLCAYDPGLFGARFVVGAERGGVGLFERFFGGMRLVSRLLELGFARGEVGLRLLGDAAEALDLVGFDHDPAAKLEPLVRRLVELEIFELATIRDEALRFRGLPLQRCDAAFELADDVADAQQVLLGQLHFPFGLLLPALELGDAGRFLDEEAPVFRLRADDEPDLALFDDRVRLRADAGAEEEIGDVLQADGRFVDQVLAVARAVEAARDGDLGVVFVFEREVGGVVVVEGEGDLGVIGRRARLGPVEDHVLHRAAAKMLGALLAHTPADRVDNIRLSASVWAYDAHDFMVEAHDRAIDERLESAELETLDLHRLSSAIQ